MVPQWDLLDLLADAGAEEPTFTLRRNAEVTDLLHEGDRVVGVRSPTARTARCTSCAPSLTVACDGRGSAVRAAAGLRPRGFGVPMDVLVVPAAAARTATRPGSSAAVGRGQMHGDDRPRRLLAVRLPHPQGQRRRLRAEGIAGSGDG